MTEMRFPLAPRATAITRRAMKLMPGVLLCVLVGSVSFGLEGLERRIFDGTYVEALVMAILLGIVVRAFWTPAERWQYGIAFSAKQLLEVAVLLLGASISFGMIADSGLLLMGTVVLTVFVTLGATLALSRMLKLPLRLSILIACGNSICGNSAIAAVAPVIGATADDIASSISFTAILGVLMVLGLPLLIPLLHLTATQYGILAGLTVYAVPQVLAATVPAGIISVQIGTVVKLVRVLMLGPVVVGLSLVASRWHDVSNRTERRRFDLLKFVPWFIVGFLALAVLRSIGAIPNGFVDPIRRVTVILTVISMAALGLGVDVRVLGKVGVKVTTAVTLSLLFLLALGIGLVQFFK